MLPTPTPEGVSQALPVRSVHLVHVALASLSAQVVLVAVPAEALQAVHQVLPLPDRHLHLVLVLDVAAAALAAHHHHHTLVAEALADHQDADIKI